MSNMTIYRKDYTIDENLKLYKQDILLLTVEKDTSFDQIKELDILFKELFPDNKIIIIPECVTQLDILSSH